MATHSSILAWRILWTEEPGRLQSMESQRVGHDRATYTFCLGAIKNIIPQDPTRTNEIQLRQDVRPRVEKNTLWYWILKE